MTILCIPGYLLVLQKIPSLPIPVAVRLHQFGWGFGVGFFCLIWNNIPEDLKLLQGVPIATSYQHRLTRKEKVGVPGAVQKERKGFCYHINDARQGERALTWIVQKTLTQ